MKSNELRIGNLIEYRISDRFDKRKEWWEVSEIDADDIHWLSKVMPEDEDFKAIPLTEEWLLKFGFEKEYGAFKLKGLKCWLTKYTSEPNLYSVNIGNIKLSTLKYVHELQNLYFALTGGGFKTLMQQGQ